MKEPVGTIGVGVPPRMRRSWDSFLWVMPAIATGNTVIAIPSEQYPLIAGDLYQVFETSDLPDGVINIVTGPRRGITEDSRRTRRHRRHLVLY